MILPYFEDNYSNIIDTKAIKVKIQLSAEAWAYENITINIKS